jgi:amidase
MSRSVEDNPRLLRVIAGPDGVDPRQHVPDNYSLDLSGGVDSIRISIVDEGFGSGSMADVADLVRATVGRTAKFGVTVKETSIPLHSEGMTIWLPIILEGTLAALLADGAAPGVGGLHMPDFVRRLGSWKRNPNALSDVLRVLLVAGRAIVSRQGNVGYATAHQMGRHLTAAYNKALAEADVLAMPTLMRTPSRIPAPGASLEERFSHAVETVTNTAPFNLTGHPALSLPVGMVDGLPVGLMLIGRHFEEGTIYRIAAVIEEMIGGPPPVVMPDRLKDSS